jgi:MerR family transcriptional regulator, light-induced transcriptional regulator
MRDLRVDEAAAVLCVSPAMLRAWEQRFGYPHSVFGAAGQRRYSHGEVIALRDRLDAELSVASAINTARALATDSQTPNLR